MGESGKVYSFDIQDQALDRTRKKIEEKGLLDRVVLIKDGHQYMDAYVRERVKVIMFNLGYLPGGDHSVGTKSESTVAAIEKSMKLLQINGIISMVVYYGGDSGFEEKEDVMKYIESIDCRKYTVMKTEFVNQINCPPILVLIEKFHE